MAGYRENNDFVNAILPRYFLDDAIEWIQENMNPEDVFSDEKLKEWAENNGLVVIEEEVL